MLLLIEEDENNHYVFMRDLSQFVDIKTIREKLIPVSVVFIAFIEQIYLKIMNQTVV